MKVHKYVLNIVCVCILALVIIVLHSHLWPVWLYHIFPHYLMTQHDFWKKKKLLNIKCVF